MPTALAPSGLRTAADGQPPKKGLLAEWRQLSAGVSGIDNVMKVATQN